MEIGLGVGVVCAALVLLAVIVIGPSRRVRAESKMPIETQVRLLLGLPEETGEMRVVGPTDHGPGPSPFDTAQFSALSSLDGPESESEPSTGAA